jgi:agmatine deiminase
MHGGGKYPPFDDDNKLPAFFSEKFGIPRFETGLILEGGSIETNGEGTLLTTESVLLNKNRNPGHSKADIEKVLRDYLGMEKIIWLIDGLAGDDTDGHIDDLSRFLNPGTILTVLAEDPDDINYEALNKNYQILQKSADPDDNPFNIEVLPLPETRIGGTTADGSEYVPASYANFYIANGVVLVPLYDSRYDDQAIELFKRYFPDRDVAGIHCSDLVWGQGSIHCITQQLYGIDRIHSAD